MFGISNVQVASSDFKVNRDRGSLIALNYDVRCLLRRRWEELWGDPFHEVSVLYWPTIFFLEYTCSLLFFCYLSMIDTEIQRSAMVGLNLGLLQLKDNLTCSINSHGRLLDSTGIPNLTWASLDWRRSCKMIRRCGEMPSAIASGIAMNSISFSSFPWCVCLLSIFSCNSFRGIAEIYLNLSNFYTTCRSND